MHKVTDFIIKTKKMKSTNTLKATFSHTTPSERCMALKNSGNYPGANGKQNWYIVTGSKEAIKQYIEDVTTDDYNPVDEDNVVFYSTPFPTVSDTPTLRRSRKEDKDGNYRWNLSDSAFERLNEQLDKVNNTLLQQRIIDAKADNALGMSTIKATASAIASVEIEDDEPEGEGAKPKTKKANPAKDVE